MSNIEKPKSPEPAGEGAFIAETLPTDILVNTSFGPTDVNRLSYLNSDCISVFQNTSQELSYLRSLQISGLFDQGSVRVPEDKIIIKPPFFCVLDGTSGVFYPGVEATTYKSGRTGGQVAGDIVATYFANASKDDDILEILGEANQALALTHVRQGLSLDSPGTLGGAVGVVAKIGPDMIEIVQWGDCFYALKDRLGNTMMAANQVFHHDYEMKTKIAALMSKHDGDRTAMWREFGPFLIEKRNERVNSTSKLGYGFLCGQPQFMDYVKSLSLPTKAVDRLALFSDGLIFYPDSEDQGALGETLLKQTNALTGLSLLESILATTRAKESAVEHESHVSHAECAALVVDGFPTE